jgi:tRNA threonylcarbamoyladenosine biosynthesis protein TsaB
LLTGLDALPTAVAMLQLAPALLAAGQAVAASQALPLYVRDKVAKTTVERAAEKAEKELFLARNASPGAHA